MKGKSNNKIEPSVYLCLARANFQSSRALPFFSEPAT